MAAPKRTRFQRETDLLKLSELYLKGQTQAEIAALLGVSQPQISNDLATLRGRWQKAATTNIDKLKARELAKVDRLEREYWDAWQRSLEADKTIKTRGKVQQSDDGTRFIREQPAEQTAHTDAGDPRYLEGVRWCIERRCKILGIDAPMRQEHTGAGGGPIDIAGVEAALKKIYGAKDDAE